jgi:hypothetical protein
MKARAVTTAHSDFRANGRKNMNHSSSRTDAGAEYRDLEEVQQYQELGR